MSEMAAGLLGALGAMELYRLATSYITKDRIFDALADSDDFIKQNKEDARAYFETMWRINPMLMSDINIARSLVRESIAVGGVPMDRIKVLAGTTPSKPLRDTFKMLGGA